MKHISITIFALSLTYDVHACDCIMYPIETYINTVDIIFTGKVIELRGKVDSTEYPGTPANREFYKSRSYEAKVIVLEKLKTGELKSDTLEFTSYLFSNCDPLHKLGESYLFFADKTKNKT